MSDTTQRRRATSLEEYRALPRMSSDEGKAAWKSFQPRPTDTIITPYGKSGTTWLQQIVHSLRTRGDMDFDDISRVVPWLETSYDLGLDINAEQKANPRAFKSHLNWHDVPKGGRYIVSIRNPKDVLVSGYRFMEGWFFEPGAIAINEWAQESFMKPDEGKGYWNHLISWWEQRDRPDVLLLAYEQMKRDLSGTIRRVADFTGIELDEALEAIVNRHASFEFMLTHKDKFDDKMMRERSERVSGLPPGSDSAKVRKGKVGEHRHELPPEIVASLDAIWQQTITPRFGFPHYEDLAAALAWDGKMGA
ncbi:MAG: sulfotransferase domain-containing protein [Caldilineaceae bacterium]